MAIQLNRHTRAAFAATLIAACFAVRGAYAQSPAWMPGGRVLLDAHNCYPYDGKWGDRIARALSTGTPLAIEQDLAWYTDPKTGTSRSIVTHGRPMTGNEPSLEEYFFAPVEPLLRAALTKGDDGTWPIVTLNLDFKDSSPAHCRAVWDILKKYEALTSTAVKTASLTGVSKLDIKPLLILTSGAGGQLQVFYDDVPVGAKLLLFGAAETDESVPAGITGEERGRYIASIPPAKLVAKPADNFHRWWNNSWAVVEAGGAPRAGDWTAEDAVRLKALVNHAHGMGYWIRFYTLNGHTPEESQGWDRSYNVGTREAVDLRWRAEISAGVDFVATDMYEAFASTKKLALGERRNEK